MKKIHRSGFVATLLLVCSVAFSAAASASMQLHHGANCSSVNDSQSRYFSKSKDGIQNNYSSRLFVICPVNIDITDSDRVPIFDITITMLLPPFYATTDINEVRESLTTGPVCSFRVGSVFLSEPNSLGTVRAFTGFFNSTGVGLSTIVTRGGGFLATGNMKSTPVLRISALSSSHLICLMPIAATLIQYSVSKI